MNLSTSGHRVHSATIAIAFSLGACSPTPTGTVRILGNNAIEFPATVQSSAFAQGEPAGYHLVVWGGGHARDHALFVSSVDDAQVVDALESLGAVPGDALSIDTWEKRYDTDAAAPDRTIEGPRIKIELLVPGYERPLALNEILVDTGDRGVDMRFGGHRANIAAWHSGCVVCLYSCPGSKVGNAHYTVRDFVTGGPHYTVRSGVLPADGTEIAVRLRLIDGGPYEAVVPVAAKTATSTP